MVRLRVNREFLVVLLSILVQLPLAVFLGHYYDQRSFLDTGYLVSSGLNPYQPHLVTIFSNPEMIGINPIIGYPPLWPLLLGLIYRLTYNLLPNLFLYNFFIKLPVIISNIALAYVTRIIMLKLNAPAKTAWFAWLFLLFNPFTLITTTAWGEYDTLIALLSIASLYFLSKGGIVKSSVLLSLSVVLKPISFPLLGLPLLFSTSKGRRKNILYLFITFALLITLWFLPFIPLGWTIPFSQDMATSYFRMAGGLTVFNIVELFHNPESLSTSFDILGYLWVPALIIGYYIVYRKPPKTMSSLTEYALALLLIFFLTRSWISEPNLNLLLPLILIMIGIGKISWKTLHMVWIIPFVFLFLNYAVPQLFFLSYPQIIPAIGTFDLQIGTPRLVARFIVTIFWYILATQILLLIVRRKND